MIHSHGLPCVKMQLVGDVIGESGRVVEKKLVKCVCLKLVIIAN